MRLIVQTSFAWTGPSKVLGAEMVFPPGTPFKTRLFFILWRSIPLIDCVFNEPAMFRSSLNVVFPVITWDTLGFDRRMFWGEKWIPFKSPLTTKWSTDRTEKFFFPRIPGCPEEESIMERRIKLMSTPATDDPSVTSISLWIFTSALKMTGVLTSCLCRVFNIIQSKGIPLIFVWTTSAFCEK